MRARRGEMRAGAGHGHVAPAAHEIPVHRASTCLRAITLQHDALVTAGRRQEAGVYQTEVRVWYVVRGRAGDCTGQDAAEQAGVSCAEVWRGVELPASGPDAFDAEPLAQRIAHDTTILP